MYQLKLHAFSPALCFLVVLAVKVDCSESGKDSLLPVSLDVVPQRSSYGFFGLVLSRFPHFLSELDIDRKVTCHG